MFNYNKLIREMNKHFIDIWGKPYPLASGNCGIFAISFSRFLKKNNIPHHVEVWSSSIKEETEFTPSELIDNNILPDHVVVILENGYSVDFEGVRKPHHIEKLTKLWNLGKLNRYKVKNYFEFGMESYTSQETCEWLTRDIFDEYIDIHW